MEEELAGGISMINAEESPMVNPMMMSDGYTSIELENLGPSESSFLDAPEVVKPRRSGSFMRYRRASSLNSSDKGFQLAIQSVKQIEEEVTSAITNEAKEVKREVKEALLGHRTFHIAWTVYVIGISFIGGLIYSSLTGNGFVDSWFQTTSATVNGGLSVVDQFTITKSAFGLTAVLMTLGSGSFMLLPTLIYRCISIRKLLPGLQQSLRHPDLTDEDNDVLQEYLVIYEASKYCAFAVLLYMLSWIFIGSVLLYGALSACKMEEELNDRGFSFYENALFLSISAFTNSGITLSSNGLVYLGHNSAALFVVSILILAGNVLLPVLLRYLIYAMYLLSVKYERTSMSGPLAYILDNPRRITTHLFNEDSSLYLLQMAALNYGILFLFFLMCCLYRDSMDKYGSHAVVAGLGFFQILNFRHAGFNVFNLRDWPQDLLFVSAVAMYLSPLPGIGLLHNSEVASLGSSDRHKSERPLLEVMKKTVLKVWFLRFLVVIFLCRVEDKYLTSHPEEINLWYIIFELISAFGMVGVSIGLLDKSYSLSGRFSPIGKLFVIMTFYMGKNRAMPKLSDPVIHFHFRDLEQILMKYEMTGDNVYNVIFEHEGAVDKKA